VKTSEDGNKGFRIDTRYNDNVFVLETDKNLLFLSAMPHTTTLTPRMKFRAIVTAEGKFNVLSYFLFRNDLQYYINDLYYKSKQSPLKAIFQVDIWFNNLV
jgi:hypothetical protein